MPTLPSRACACGLAARAAVLAALCFATTASQAQAYDFRWFEGGYQDIGHAINARGDVVGASNVRPVYPTWWRNGVAQHLPTLQLPTYYGGAAHAINNTGQIAGQDAASIALLWNGVDVTRLPTLPDARSAAFGLNDLGQAVGWSARREGPGGWARPQATLWSGGTWFDLGTLGGPESQALDINNRGQVAGWSYLADGSTRHATLWQNGQSVDLGTAGGHESWANAVNEHGVAVGASAISTGDQRAVVWHDGTPTVLDLLPGDWYSSVAYGINDRGQVVGSSFDRHSGFSTAILWNGSAATDLNAFLSAEDVEAGWHIVHASGINDLGWITGTAYNRLTYDSVAYILAPVPEPAALSLLAVGLGVLALGRRRRRCA